MTRRPLDSDHAEVRPAAEECAPRARSRRELLRQAALLGAAAPLVVTLLPGEARAQGSWAAPGLRDPYAGRPDMFESQAKFGRGGWVIPYSYEWRRREEARLRAEEAARRRGY